MKRLLKKLFRPVTGEPSDRLSCAKDFLNTVTVAVRENKTLMVYVAAGDRVAAVLLPGGGHHPVVEYLYNFAAGSVHLIQADMEMLRRSCGKCEGLDCCQMVRDKNYPCEFFDVPACDGEAAHVG